MTQWPYEKTERRQAYEDYRADGGLLDYFAWLAAGEPSITEAEEENILAYLSYLDRYLASEIAAGVLKEGQASAILDDENAQMYGLGAYEGAAKPFFQMPNYKAVTSYLRGLPIQEQKRLDEEARVRQQQVQEAQQQAQEIASQRAKLPLRAGGTIQQQIQAGELARRNLQLQLSSAPDYMQDTIREQIADLGKGISQLQGTDLLMAKERAIKAGWDEEPGPLPRYGSFTKEIAEKYGMSLEKAVSTGMMYQSNPEREEYANLTKEERSDLSAVAEEASAIAYEDEPPRTVKPVKPFEGIPRFRELDVAGSPAWKSWFGQRYPTIVSQFRGKEAGERTEAGWTSYLEKERARIKAEFTKQSPYSRGERPGAFAPKIKTVAW